MPTFVTPPSMATKTTMGTRGAHVARALDVRRTARGIAHRRVTRNVVGGPGTSPQQHHSHRPPRSRTAVCTRGAHHPRVHAASISLQDDTAWGGDSNGPPTTHPRAHRYEHPPETYRSSPGEKFLMQFGESMRIEELPAGTRVVYPGVRKNAPSSPKEMRAMVESALDDPVGQPPLRDKIRDLVKAKGSNGCK